MSINKEFDKLATDSADHLALKMVAIKEFFLKNYGEKSTANILSKLNKMFKSLGEGFEKINDKNFDKAFKLILKADFVNLNQTQKNELMRYKSLMLDEMKLPTTRLKNEYKKALILNQTENVTQSKLLKDLNNYSTKKFKRHVKTSFNTYLQRTYASATWESIKGDYKYYVYSGARDSVNRPYPCAIYANKVIPPAKAAELMGERLRLYNCRHTIIPFTGTEAEAKARLVH